MRKTFIVFLLILISLILVLTGLIIVPANSIRVHAQHDLFPTMLKSDDASQSELILWLAFFFGVFSICLFTLFLYIGISGKNFHRKKLVVIVTGLIVYVGIFSFGFASYLEYIQNDSFRVFLGFPAPTAWMLYGIWFFPLFFTFLYVVKFNDWVLKPDDYQRLQSIIKSREQRTKRRKGEKEKRREGD
ncbi:MAG: hypothetical protein IIB05_08930 [Bacteroidetes bacterium]|nr:hypothetical protein [Bacteroidota bacterium]